MKNKVTILLILAAGLGLAATGVIHSLQFDTTDTTGFLRHDNTWATLPITSIVAGSNATVQTSGGTVTVNSIPNAAGLTNRSSNVAFADLELTNGLTVDSGFLTNKNVIFLSTNLPAGVVPNAAFPNGSFCFGTNGDIYARTNAAWVQIAPAGVSSSATVQSTNVLGNTGAAAQNAVPVGTPGEKIQVYEPGGGIILTSNSIVTITNMVLTTGDWELNWGAILPENSNNVWAVAVGVSTVSGSFTMIGSMTGTGGAGSLFDHVVTVTVPTNTIFLGIGDSGSLQMNFRVESGSRDIAVITNTTLYLSIQAEYNGNVAALNAGAWMKAVRSR